MTDTFEAARSHINKNIIESLFSSSGCHWRGDQFVTLSPLELHDTIGGFEIHETGLWHDFRSDEGGDFIDLISQVQNISKLDAAKYIIKKDGGSMPEKAEYKKPESPPYKKFDHTDKKFKDSLLLYLKQDWQKKISGELQKVYVYKDMKGKGIFCTVRFIKDGKKSIKPVYMDSLGKFYNRAPSGIDKYLPYCVEKLRGNTYPVIIVEGEKCADIEIPGYIIISAYNINKTDWSCLENRDIFIWPDLDCEKDDFNNYKPIEKQPGYIKALKYKIAITHANTINVYGKYEMGEKKHGWDIADAIAEGKSIPDLIKDIGIVGSVDVDLIPFDVYMKFIEMEYNHNGLEQVSGVFWNYDSEDHYWKKTNRKNLDVHLQKWIFDTNIIKLLHTIKNVKPTTFINDALSYLHRHSSNFFKDNPFKDSALSPYIHHKDGVIEITQDNIKFITREGKDENYFKKMYPIFCFDYGLSEELFNNFNLEKECPAFNYFIEEMVPKTIKTEKREKEIALTKSYMAQILAYALSPLKYDAFIFNVTGNQHTGKTFFIDIIKEFIGQDFVLERSMSSMENRFSTYDLWGSKVFVESDISADKTIPDDFIKKYAGEIHGVTVEQKNEDPVKGVKLSIAMFFVSNYQIKFGNKIEGIERRLCPIPFKNKLLKKDKLLLNKILGVVPKGEESGIYKGKQFSELPGILAFALHGWQHFVENNYTFIFPEWVAQEKEYWKMSANTVIKYMTETYKLQEFSETITRQILYQNYKDWCIEEGEHYPFGKKGFYDVVRRMDYVKELNTCKPEMFVVDCEPKMKEYDDDIPI